MLRQAVSTNDIVLLTHIEGIYGIPQREEEELRNFVFSIFVSIKFVDSGKLSFW